MRLKEIAHARTGDKGNHANIAVVAYRAEHYPLLKDKLTVQRVQDFFGEFCQGPVERFEADNCYAINFVLHDALGGGVTRSLAMDKHGKALGMALLELELDE